MGSAGLTRPPEDAEEAEHTPEELSGQRQREEKIAAQGRQSRAEEKQLKADAKKVRDEWQDDTRAKLERAPPLTGRGKDGVPKAKTASKASKPGTKVKRK